MEQHEGTQPGSVNQPQLDLNKTPEAIASGPPPAPPVGADSAMREGSPPSEPGVGEENPSWWRQNGPLLIMVAAVLGFLLLRFDPETIIKVAIGLSLVIFIHELGHFLVAKWCDVHVTTFSIGFGPPIPGCSFKWGETTYKLALLPLGGYVQMVGQTDGDETSDGSEDDPRSYRNKSVGQRMAIISAGVIMNVLLAIVCFVAVYRIPGRDSQAAVVAAVDPGAPAYKVGVRTGDVIEQVGTVKNPLFDDLKRVVMSTVHGQYITVVVRPRGAEKPLELAIMPRKDPDDLVPVIGIVPTQRPQFRERRFVSRTVKSPTIPLSPAAQASPAFDFGDRIIGTTDPNDPTQVTSLPDDPRYPGHDQTDYFEFARRMQLLAGKDVIIRVQREGVSEPIDCKVTPAYHWSLGIVMNMGEITAIRNDSPAIGRVIARDKDKNIKGDVIDAVSYVNKAGKTVRIDGKNLDPLRLPHLLRQAMAELPKDKAKKVTLHLIRKRAETGTDTKKEDEVLEWNDAWAFDRDIPLSPSSPWAIPELGLAYQVRADVANVTEDVKDNPFKAYDEIKAFRITFQAEKAGKEPEVSSWSESASLENWAFAFTEFNSAPVQIESIEFKVKRGNETKEIKLTPVLDKSWPMIERGWVLSRDDRNVHADNIPEALVLGLKGTRNFMLQVFENLRGMFSGRLSYRLLGGPITIARVAYITAGVDFWEFVFFLGMVSVNLAVINFLPIPVLDGGHMVLLIYEKIRGQPASEAVRNGATLAGLALILTLLVFVLYLDISRLF